MGLNDHPVMFLNTCTGKSHLAEKNKPAPLIRVEPPVKRTWDTSTPEEILADIRRFARNPGTI